MRYSSSPLVDYCDEVVEYKHVNNSFVHVIEIVSEMARRISK